MASNQHKLYNEQQAAKKRLQYCSLYVNMLPVVNGHLVYAAANGRLKSDIELLH